MRVKRGDHGIERAETYESSITIIKFVQNQQETFPFIKIAILGRSNTSQRPTQASAKPKISLDLNYNNHINEQLSNRNSRSLSTHGFPGRA